jgi:hypothetical protein
MLEFLIGVLEIVLDIAVEVAVQVAVEYLVGLVLRAIVTALGTSEPESPWLAGFGYLCLGGIAGGISLLIFPYPLIHPSRFHGISVIVSPVLTGLAMSLMGSVLRRRGKIAMQIESFGYGFAFAFGMALVRFLFVKV